MIELGRLIWRKSCQLIKLKHEFSQRNNLSAFLLHHHASCVASNIDDAPGVYLTSSSLIIADHGVFFDFVESFKISLVSIEFLVSFYISPDFI